MDRNCPRTLSDEIPLCLYAIDPDGRPVSIDLADLSRIGAECDGSTHPCPHLKLVPPQDWQKVRRLMTEVFAGHHRRLKPTTSKPPPLRNHLAFCLAPCPNGQVKTERLLGLACKLARNRQAEDGFQRQIRVHNVLSRCNRCIARAADERTLLDTFCVELAESGGYGFVWVGYLGGRDGARIRLVACAGRSGSALAAALRGSAKSGEHKSAWQVVRETGAPVVLRDLSPLGNDLAPWSEVALRQGYRSAILLPLPTNGPHFGCLSMLSDQSDAFDERELALLDELAQDLAFGLRTLRERAAAVRAIQRRREETEREIQAQLATTLHDGIGQTLQALNLDLKQVRANAQRAQPIITKQLDRLVAESDEALRDLRAVNGELHLPLLDRLPLLDAVRLHCDEAAERTDTTIHVHADGAMFVLDQQTKLQCFLAFREALSNALRHAHASRVEVYLRVRPRDQLTLIVVDNGVGIKSHGAGARGSGLGLSIIRERAAALQGRVDVRSRCGRGTLVRIRFPLSEESRPCP